MHKNKSNTTNTRRVPKQKRSIEKVERILDCAAQLMMEKGVDNLTTQDVAQQAGIAIGSLYQFFPNIELVKIALVERVMDKLHSVIIETLDKSHSKQLVDLTIDTIDAILNFYNNYNDIVKTIVSSRHSEAFLIVNESLNERVIDALILRVKHLYPTISEKNVRRKVKVSVSFGDAMMILVWSAKDEAERHALVSEWKLLATRYAEYIHIVP